MRTSCSDPRVSVANEVRHMNEVIIRDLLGSEVVEDTLGRDAR